MLAAFVGIPKINKVFADQHDNDLLIEQSLEIELFNRYVQGQYSVLRDLAEFPSVVNSAMLSDGSNISILDFFDNVVIGGEKARLALQDIAGNVIIETEDNILGNYETNIAWTETLLDGSSPYSLRLISQERNLATFQFSVPVMYGAYIEGILTAEITTPLEKIFVAQNYDANIAFRLEQGGVKIETSSDHIRMPRENAVDVAATDLTFIYITDDAPILAKERQLRNTTLSVLLVGLLISFLLFALLGYQQLAVKDDGAEKESTNWRNYLFPMLIALIGTATSIAAYLIVQNSVRGDDKNTFIKENVEKIQTIQSRIEINILALASVANFFNASEVVNNEEFGQFAKPLIAKVPSITALGWIPGSSIIEQNKKNLENGRVDTRKKTNNAYYLVTSQGFTPPENIGQEPMQLLRETIFLSQNEGQNVSTPPMPFNLKKSKEMGVIVFSPVFNKELGISDDEGSFLGAVMMIFTMSDIITGVYPEGNQTFAIYIEDITNPAYPETVYGATPDKVHKSHVRKIEFAGRKWNVTVYDNEDNMPLDWLSLLVLLTGLIFTALVTYGFMHLIRRRNIVENLVKRRTVELNQAVEKLTDSNEELTRFAYVCSHDLQEPLRMIRSFSEKLEVHLEKTLEGDEKGQKYFRFVTSGASRAQDLISDILTYSSIGSDTQRFTAVNCDELMEAIKINMTVNLEASGGNITYDELPEIRGHKTQLLQLLQNLINNGLKYQKRDDTPHVHVSSEDIGGHWKFSIQDNGIGMDARHLDKIFDVFQRLNRQSQYAGTGVGLSICKKIVERHNGKIWVDSTKGVGSTFYFTILKPSQ